MEKIFLKAITNFVLINYEGGYENILIKQVKITDIDVQEDYKLITIWFDYSYVDKEFPLETMEDDDYIAIDLRGLNFND